jgi:hypothetical protein
MGKANGEWKHGGCSQAAKTERFITKLLLKDASSLRRLLTERGTGNAPQSNSTSCNLA